MLAVGPVAVHDGGGAAGGEAVLVEVGRDRRDAGDAEVPGRDVVTVALDEGEEEAADAGVDVHGDAALLSGGGERGDVVDRAEGVVQGAEPTTRTVFGVMAARTASTSAR